MSPSYDTIQNDDAGFGAWLLSCILGIVALPFVAWIIMAAIFGVDRRDSSAVWGLAGLGPLLVVIMLWPAYIIPHITAFCILRKRATKATSVVYSAMIGVFVSVAATCLYWHAHHIGSIIQAH